MAPIPPGAAGLQDSPTTSECQTAVPGARAALVLLLLINMFNYIDRQVLAAVVPQIKHTFFGPQANPAETQSIHAMLDWCQEHLGFQPENALIGVLSMAFMVVYMIGAPVFGKLAERWSRWALIGIGVVLWSLASGASGLASSLSFLGPGFLVLLATRCFVGVGEAAYGPVAPTLISDFYPVSRRGQVLAWFYMAIPVGSALGYVLGEQVAKSSIGDWGSGVLGIRAEGWCWAFYLVVAPGLALGVWSFFMREPSRGQADQAAAAAAAAAPSAVRARDYLVLLRTPSYVLCTLGMTAMTFAMGGIGFWMPYYLEHRPHVTGSPTTMFGILTVVAGLSATLLGGWVGDRLRPRFPGSYFLVSGAAMLAGFPFMLATLATPFPAGSGFPWIWVLIFMTCFCLFFNTGPSNTILANVTQPSIRASGFALNILVIHALGDVISPVIIGIISDRYNMDLAFQVVGAMFVLAAIFWFWGTRYLQRDTAAALHGPS
jgi:MFS family permease